MDWKSKNVLVTGGNGFLGSRLVKILKEKNTKKIVIPDSKKYDLRNVDNCVSVLKEIDIVFHLAAKVGGIGLNQSKPGELFYDNLMMGVNLMEEARRNKIEKFISLGTICSYPKFTPLPFKEDSIWALEQSSSAEVVFSSISPIDASIGVDNEENIETISNVIFFANS